MPVIKGARQFEGSNFDQNSLFAYIKPDVRQLKFDKKTNQDGLYVIFLPAYKQDSNGDGVWFKAVSIRNNFGADKAKKAYYIVDPNKDPATYFERAFKARFPDQSKVVKVGETSWNGVVNNNKFPIYPNYGHVTQRVVFNVGVLAELQKGSSIDKVVHVLDLPGYKGADQLTKWMNTPQPDGSMSPLINDNEAAVAVHVKLVSEVSKDGGWTLAPSLAHRYKVPDTYAASENIYNLDNIFIEKDKNEIISDLRGMYPANVFDACMDGFEGFKANAVAFPTNPTATPVSELPVAQPPAPPAPPETMIASVVTPLPPPANVAPAVSVTSLPPPAPAALPANPIAVDDGIVVGGNKVSQADLRAFLESKTAK